MAQLENFRLKVFRAVAEHLNFRKAAEHLFLTQPAVTLQIKALENDLGVRLFDRAAGRISLTRHGVVLLRYANKVASLVFEAERELGAGLLQVASVHVNANAAAVDLARAQVHKVECPRRRAALFHGRPQGVKGLHSGCVMRRG